MSISLPNGSVLSIASGYNPVKAMTAVTNANPGVATFVAGHGYAINDILEITSGWGKLNNKIVKAGVIAVNDVPLLGQDTSNVGLYPAAGGVGSARSVSGWTQLSQILDLGSEGGDQQFANYQFLEAEGEGRIPTIKSAAGFKVMIADDPALPGYLLAGVANDDRAQRAVRLALPNGSVIYYNAYITLNRTPSMKINDVMACEVTMSFLAPPVRY